MFILSHTDFKLNTHTVFSLILQRFSLILLIRKTNRLKFCIHNAKKHPLSDGKCRLIK